MTTDPTKIMRAKAFRPPDQRDILRDTLEELDEAAAREALRSSLEATTEANKAKAAQLRRERMNTEGGIPSFPIQHEGSDKDKYIANPILTNLVLDLMGKGFPPEMIGSILQGKPPTIPVKEEGEKEPKWMDKVMAIIMENALKPKEDPKLVILEDKFNNLQMQMVNTFGDIKKVVEKFAERPQVDPNVQAAQTITGIKALMDSMQALQPPPQAPPAVGDSKLAFELQSRQWEHEQNMTKLELESRRLEQEATFKARELEKKGSQWGNFAEAIGSVIAQGIVGGAVQNEPIERKPRSRVIPVEVPPGQGTTLQIQCPTCKNIVSFPASVKQAACTCGQRFKMIHSEVEAPEAPEAPEDNEVNNDTQD